jgi:hypothetical protein
MDTRNGMLAWAFAHALARVCGAAFGFAALGMSVRLWGDPRTPDLALRQLGLMVVVGLIQGLLLGLLPGKVLARLLPEAHFGRFVRNTTLLLGLRHMLAMLPVTLYTMEGSVSEALASSIYTLVTIGFALTIGPVQWLALRHYPGAGRYMVASVLAQLGGVLLDSQLQTLLPYFEPDLPAVALRLGWTFVNGGVVALPTGWVLKRLAEQQASQKT